MTAIDAFTVKQTIWDTLHTQVWHQYADSYTESLRGEREGSRAFPIPAEIGLEFLDDGDAYTRRETRAVQMSETFYVAPLMSRLVTAAAEDWPTDEPITAEDWPTPHGFMYVPGGVSTIDIRGQVNTTVAFLWEVRGDRTTVTWWTDKHYDHPALKAKDGWDEMPTYLPWHVVTLQHDHPAPTGMVMGTVIPPEIGARIAYHTDPETGSIAMMLPQGWGPEEIVPHIDTDRVTAWLVSALRIMRQPLATADRTGMPANLRRHLSRQRRPLRQKAVTVIDFRRPAASGPPGSTTREYSHRFFRRGHWRRQWMGSERTGDRRQVRIWIHPSIVNAAREDLPLLIRDHVNALTR